MNSCIAAVCCLCVHCGHQRDRFGLLQEIGRADANLFGYEFSKPPNLKSDECRGKYPFLYLTPEPDEPGRFVLERFLTCHCFDLISEVSAEFDEAVSRTRLVSASALSSLPQSTSSTQAL